MDSIINFNLIRHPLNWVTVTLMVLIVGIGLHFLLQFQGATPGKTTAAE